MYVGCGDFRFPQEEAGNRHPPNRSGGAFLWELHTILPLQIRLRFWRVMRIEIGEWQIRSFRPDDAPALTKYANNRNVWLNLSDRYPLPYRRDDAVAWIQEAMQQSPETMFAIASATEAIGGIGLDLQSDVYRRSAEVGYWLGEPFWGLGIATKSLQALTEYAFAEFDLIRLYAHVFEWNPASARVLEKVGYKYEGRLRKSITKDGQAIDQSLYAIVRE